MASSVMRKSQNGVMSSVEPSAKVFVGLDQIDAAAEVVAGQVGEVHRRLIAEQREPEAILSLERAVAAAGVAAGLGEQPHDVPLEVHARDRPAGGQLHLSGRGGGKGQANSKGMEQASG